MPVKGHKKTGVEDCTDSGSYTDVLLLLWVLLTEAAPDNPNLPQESNYQQQRHNEKLL